ncbi:ABC transporter permease [Paenibacillus agilis]|uniref:ABC transporter permease n=1 Tax=Paenibacillus agilis TaxID=3020863 RepID=A0A559ID76_9BACL|nr:ABC transporter permease [Paenibacillus agilis]TVX85617.1 ABC transporter permease [Paenibacillus agilis]
MNVAPKALILAAALFLSIAFITIGVYLFDSASESSKVAQNDFNEMNEQLAQTKFNTYENGIQTGSQVKAAIRKFAKIESFGIHVKTGKNKVANQDGSWYNNTVSVAGGPSDPTYGTVVKGASGTIANAEDQLKNDYINPSGRFKSQLVRDSNNAIRGIIFVQN